MMLLSRSDSARASNSASCSGVGPAGCAGAAAADWLDSGIFTSTNADDGWAGVAATGAEGAAKIVDVADSDQLLSPFPAAEIGYVDAIIDPNCTRDVIINELKLLKYKSKSNPRKKHSNIPL